MKVHGASSTPLSPLLSQTPSKYQGFFFRGALGAAAAANFETAAAVVGVRAKNSKMLAKKQPKSFKNISKINKLLPMKFHGASSQPLSPLLSETPRKYQGFFFRGALGAAAAANLETAAAVAGVRAKIPKCWQKSNQKASKMDPKSTNCWQ